MGSISYQTSRRLMSAPMMARQFASQPYNPKIVNECKNPSPGKLFRTMRVFGGIAVFFIATPLIVMHFDSKRFEAEMERRRQSNAS
ncbi:putative integral membrane protein [Babesia bovis T2Bo]|uniref:Uncharacterized protein n=1 Tax=Babesia bovis TaxID=5865 RepID=A7AM12_BABBO|nr:putative integral membrane protein [Babesia bovis T2Bo]EDO07596.1 putative integral membrane protein [Babesia bovis T2Bo]|eukprot:XP_001611164.1 hypothetical protein [Babesia bovis T2Bo]